MRGRLIVGLVFLALPVTLCAQVTGNKLLELCRSEDANFANGYCAGYLASHAEAVSIMRHFFGSRFYCTPEEVTLSQAKEIVVSYLKNNPAQRHELAWFLVGEALGEAFPCPQDEASPKPPPKKTPKAK